MTRLSTFNWLNVIVLGVTAAASGAEPEAAPIAIHRAAGPIAIDGDLSDEGWKGALRVDTWYEVNPGDNTPPKVSNVGYLTYDDKFFYAGFEFQDPDPSRIRAPLGDRDNVPGSTDYGGVILDTRNDGNPSFSTSRTCRRVRGRSVLALCAGP